MSTAGRRLAPPLLWAAFILLLTSWPSPDLGGANVPYGDKVVHFTLYAVLGWLSARAWRRPGAALRVGVAVLVGVSLFGAADEWHQMYIPGRSADRFDWLADTTGGACGAALALLRGGSGAAKRTVPDGA